MLTLTTLTRSLQNPPQLNNQAFIVYDSIMPRAPVWWQISNIIALHQYKLSSTGIVSGIYTTIDHTSTDNIIQVSEGVYKDWASAFWFQSTSVNVSYDSIKSYAASQSVALPGRLYLYYSFTYADCSMTQFNPAYLNIFAYQQSSTQGSVEHALIAYLDADENGKLTVNYDLTNSLYL
jgi:hypothetical protein